MQLKPFEAGRYDEDSIVVSNPDNGKQELFSEREYAIVKFLKQNEKQSLLALLMPNIGIAKKVHVEMCLRVLAKLRRIQVADYFSITGRKLTSETATIEIDLKKTPLDVSFAPALAATIYGVANKALKPLGPGGLMAAAVALAAASFALFPFDVVDAAVRDSAVAYSVLFLVAYLAACASFTLRALLQSAFLRAFGREEAQPRVALFPPFVALSADTRCVNLLGFRARVQMAILGLAAPLALSCVFTLLAMVHSFPLPVAFVGFAACVGTSLLLLCPLLSFDGASLLQALFFRGELEEKVSTKLREIFSAKDSLSRELLFAVVLAVVWLAVWLDGVRGFRETFADRLSADMGGGDVMAMLGAYAVVAALVGLVIFPAGVFGYHYALAYARKKRKRVVVPKDKLNESLTFEERISALEKIPLFACLNDQERLGLQSEMHPVFYRHGDFLVHQGEVGRELFVLVKGHASARYLDQQGKSVSLADLFAGDAFGEIALIDDVPRTASVVSEGGCIALVLRKEGFDRFADSLGSPDRVKALVRLTSFFRRHPLFSKLDAREQANLIDSFRFQTITSGERIPEGDENFHVVYSGSVRVDTGGADGETTLHSDDCFGYANPLNARYIAVEGTGLLSVPKDQFHNLIWEKLVARAELFV